MSLLERNVATEEDLSRPWSGNKTNFRCGICGNKFRLGDGYKMLYTNNIPGYGGNPLVCDKCDTPQAIDKWKSNWDEFNSIMKNPKYWRMVRDIKNRYQQERD